MADNQFIIGASQGQSFFDRLSGSNTPLTKKETKINSGLGAGDFDNEQTLFGYRGGNSFQREDVFTFSPNISDQRSLTTTDIYAPTTTDSRVFAPQIAYSGSQFRGGNVSPSNRINPTFTPETVASLSSKQRADPDISASQDAGAGGGISTGTVLGVTAIATIGIGIYLYFSRGK